jgi:histidinol-phosphate/aromatic aminotransferase/cobyric acid decarboxylase-like protein
MAYFYLQDFAAAGLRLGSLITRNAELRKAVGANMRFHHPSGPSIAIGTALLQDREFVSKFITLSRQRLKQNRDYTMAVLDSAGIKYERW